MSCVEEDSPEFLTWFKNREINSSSSSNTPIEKRKRSSKEIFSWVWGQESSSSESDIITSPLTINKTFCGRKKWSTTSSQSSNENEENVVTIIDYDKIEKVVIEGEEEIYPNFPPNYECLYPFSYCYIENQSDNSDWEDTTPEFDEDVKISIQKRKNEEKIKLERKEQQRKEIYEDCFKKIEDYFPEEGLYFKKFNHRKIKFTIKPYEINNKFHHPTEQHVISINYDPKFSMWSLGRMDTGSKDDIMGLFKRKVKDEHIFQKIYEIYKIIKEEIKETAIERRQKLRIIKRGAVIDEDIILLPIEEKILLSEEDLEAVRAKRARIHAKMRWPRAKEEEIMKKRNMLPCSLFG